MAVGTDLFGVEPKVYYQFKGSELDIISEGQKLNSDVLDFLTFIETRIRAGYYVRSEVANMTLENVIDAVVQRCDDKIDLFAKIWNAFLRFLDSLGFKKATPVIDQIHQKAELIRTVEKTSDGHSVFFLYWKLQGMASFFSWVPEGNPQFSEVPILLGNLKNQKTVKDYFAYTKLLYPYFIKFQLYCEEKKESKQRCIDPIFSNSIAASFKQLFLIMAKEADKEGNESEVASLLSQVDTVSDEQFVENFVRKASPQNAFLALSKVSLQNKAQLQVELGHRILEKPVLTDPEFEMVLKLAVQVNAFDPGSKLVLALVQKCLSANKYQIALSAVRHLHFEQCLVDISRHAAEHGDFESAKEAYRLIILRDDLFDLKEYLIRIAISKNDSQTAFEIISDISDQVKRDSLRHQLALDSLSNELHTAALAISQLSPQSITQEQKQTAAKIFDECIKKELFDSAILASTPIRSDESISASLYQIACCGYALGNYSLALNAIRVVEHPDDAERRLKLLSRLAQAAPNLFEPTQLSP